VPVLTMTYSGALRPHLYGLVLRARGRFELADWRWSGLLPAAAGIVLLPVMARRRLGAAGAALLVALVATDAGLGVLARFDFGPVAIAFLLRVLLAGLLIAALDGDGRAGAAVALGLGTVVGLAIYEKLSNVALLPAFVVGLYALSGRRLRALACAGLAAGAAPLAAVNVASWVDRGELVSLAGVGDPFPMPPVGPARLLFESLRSGQGAGPLAEVTGNAAEPRTGWLEAAAVGLLLVGALAARRLFGADLSARLAGAFGGLALAGVAALALLPRTTHSWHWVSIVPFAPLAAALALEAALRTIPRRRVATAALIVALGTLLAARAPRLVEARAALVAGEAAPEWSPALDGFARWAASQGGDALFVATDWGLAPQLYAYSNGARRFLWDAVWDPRPPSFAGALAERWRKRRLYLVRVPAVSVRPERAAAIERWLASEPHWREIAPPASAPGLGLVSLRAFERRPLLAGGP
jgi:hypothetical protein